jgi:2-(1,2-epoxy-1,2-dihydrophenyl)acetyl-CoA isomerase
MSASSADIDAGDSAPADDSAATVRWTVADGIGRLTIDRADAANALTPAMRNRIIDLLERASADLAVRVVVLAGAGRYFCTGADLRAAQPAGPARPEGAPERAVGDVARMLRTGAQRLVAAVLDCEKPVVAAVNGTAAGIGAHLALACDLVVATEEARFIEVFVRRGITPDGGGAWLLPRLVGMARAKELLFLGDDLPAADAERIGLINRCVPAEGFGAAVDDYATRLAAGPTKALSLAKWLVNRSLDTDRTGAFDDEAWAQELASRTADFTEGVQAFVERREVRFQGW